MPNSPPIGARLCDSLFGFGNEAHGTATNTGTGTAAERSASLKERLVN
jgi:hypothetical protein